MLGISQSPDSVKAVNETLNQDWSAQFTNSILNKFYLDILIG